MSKYIIKNCPAYDEGDCVSPIEHMPHATACQHIEDCKLKQIVELYKEQTQFCEDCSTLTCEDCNFSTNGFAEEVIELLDIQEVE